MGSRSKFLRLPMSQGCGGKSYFKFEFPIPQDDLVRPRTPKAKRRNRRKSPRPKRP